MRNCARTDILSCTVSKLSQIIVYILDYVLCPLLWGLEATCDVHPRLVVNFLFVLIKLFFARCYG